MGSWMPPCLTHTHTWQGWAHRVAARHRAGASHQCCGQQGGAVPPAAGAEPVSVTAVRLTASPGSRGMWRGEKGSGEGAHKLQQTDPKPATPLLPATTSKQRCCANSFPASTGPRFYSQRASLLVLILSFFFIIIFNDDDDDLNFIFSSPRARSRPRRSRAGRPGEGCSSPRPPAGCWLPGCWEFLSRVRILGAGDVRRLGHLKVSSLGRVHRKFTRIY